jgi:ABC-type sulfate/molybdate transport systems ATPase subunit
MDALSDALNKFQGGVLMVSHDVTMLQNVCTSLWVCDNGTIEHFDGSVKQYKVSAAVRIACDSLLTWLGTHNCASKRGGCGREALGPIPLSDVIAHTVLTHSEDITNPFVNTVYDTF